MNEYNLETLGGRVQYAREVHGECMTQTQLAKAARITQSHVALIEANKRTPGVPVLMRIARVTGVRCDYLLYGAPKAVISTPEYSYAEVQLLGHQNLGACKVREIDDLGGKALEVTELRQDGSDGTVRIVAPAALYSRILMTKEEAMRAAGFEADAPPILNPPLNAICGLVAEVRNLPGRADLKSFADSIQPWIDQQMDDIPF